MQPAELDTLHALLSAGRGDGPSLRAALPQLTVTRCDAGDVDQTPYRRYAGFDLHLVDGAGHCWQLTTDPAAATGIVLARQRP
ncbi:MAG: hypothetical protein ACOY6E_04875 [Pseudomonadota bacterium]